MTKDQRLIDSLEALLKEQFEIETAIEGLPRGYISVKHISGHTYHYRQWREGDKIHSEYVPEAFLSGVKRKIAARKEQEEALKAVTKEIKTTSRYLLKHEMISEEEIEDLRKKARA